MTLQILQYKKYLTSSEQDIYPKISTKYNSQFQQNGKHFSFILLVMGNNKFIF